MRTLHKIKGSFTEEQIAAAWWFETNVDSHYKYAFSQEGLLIVLYPEKNLKPQLYSKLDMKYCLNMWRAKGKPIIPMTRYTS